MDTDRLDSGRRFTNSCHVEKNSRKSADIHTHFDDIPRRAGGCRCNRRFAACQVIEKRGFSDIWRADYCDLETLANPLCCYGSINLRIEILTELIQYAGRFCLRGCRHFLISKIYGGFDESGRTRQIMPPGFCHSAQRATVEAQGLLALGIGFSIYEVGKTFDTVNSDAPVLQCAKRKLAWLSSPQIGHSAKCCKNCTNGCRSAMNMEFDCILAGIACRLFEQYQNPPIKNVSIPVPQCPE